MPRSSSSRAACCMASMSLFEPITMPTRGASTSIPASSASTSASAIGSGANATSGAPPRGSPRSARGALLCLLIQAAAYLGLLQRRDEVLDGDRHERLVARGAARAELQRDARDRALVGRLDDRDEVHVAEGRPLRLDGGAELLDLAVDLLDALRVVLDRLDAL